MAIKVYGWQDAEYQNMVKFVELLQKHTGGSYQVKNIYFDAGQDWWWTTIVNKDIGYQILNPRQQEQITGGDFTCLDEVVETYFRLKKQHLELALTLLERKREQYTERR